MNGKVNSESDFNENLVKKLKENQESLSFIQKFKLYIKRSIAVIVHGFSMSGVYEDGDVVGAKKVTRFSRYKKGDIIVFTNKKGERVIHMIVDFTYENGKKEYITWGVNNQELDNDPVPRDKIVGKAVYSAKEQYKILSQAKQGKILIIDAHGMVNVKNLPNSWNVFKSENNQEFYEKLIDFRGNDYDLDYDKKIGGGEGKIFTSDKYDDRILKRWFSSELSKFGDSVGLLESVGDIIENDPELNQYIEVVKIYDEGNDWIERDFYKKSIELKKAILNSDKAETAYKKVMKRLQQLCLSSKNPDLHTLYERFDRTKFNRPNPSANLHWEDNLNKIIIIDMM